MKNIMITIIGLIVLTCVGICIYFVGNVSAVIPSIKTYEITNNSAKQTLDSIQSLSISNSNLRFRIIDTIGNKMTGVGYEIITKYDFKNDTLEYHLKCVEDKIDGKKSETKIKLIGAHNFKTGTGGYTKESKGMDILLSKFDSVIITPLKKKGIKFKR